MGAFAMLAIVVGTFLAWGGPIDPEYAEDWAKFTLGILLAGWGLWYLTRLWVPG